MKGTTLSYALKQEEAKHIEIIKKALTKQANEFNLEYFATCFYGKSFHGGRLDPETYRKRWDRGQVIRTHRFIRNQLKKCFGDIKMIFIIERHKPFRDPSGNLKEGSFHTHLYISEIPDSALQNPSRTLTQLIRRDSSLGTEFHMRNLNSFKLKELLLNAVIRTSRWIGSYPPSLKIDRIETSTFDYCFGSYGLKQYQQYDDLNTAIDWSNSSFYNPTTKETIK